MKLQTSDGKTFAINFEIAKYFGTITTMIEVCGFNMNHESIIPLPNINSGILHRILQWISYKQKAIKENETKCDSDFLDVDCGKNF